MPGGVQGWDRYAYVNNNPLKYTDPSGHDVGCAGYDAGSCGRQANYFISSIHDYSSDLKIKIELGMKARNNQIIMPETSINDYAYVPDPATGYQTITEAKPIPNALGVIVDLIGPYAQGIAFRAEPYNVSVNVYIDAYQSSDISTTWTYVPRGATVINNSSGAYNPRLLSVGNSKTILGGLLQPGETSIYNLDNQSTTVSFGESLSISTYGFTYTAGGNDPLDGFRMSSASLFQDSLAYLFRITFSSGALGYVH